MGNGFRGVDGLADIGYYAGQAQATRPRPANRRHPSGVQKGEVNLTTPTTAELLAQEVRDHEADRFAVWRLAQECETMDEFRKRLADLLNLPK